MDLREEIIQILEKAKNKIVSNIDSEGITASGKTKQSLKVVSNQTGIVLIQDATGAPFETLQYGREGGKVPKGFQKIIEMWINEKGLSVEPKNYIRKPSEKWQPKYTPEQRGLMAMAGAIATNIKNNGTKRFREPNENVYSKAIDEAIKEISKLAVDSVISEVRK